MTVKTAKDQRWAEHFRAVNEVGNEITRILSEESLLPSFVDTVYRTFNYNVFIFLLDPVTKTLILKDGVMDYCKPLPKEVSVVKGAGVVGRVFGTLEPLMANDLRDYFDVPHPINASARSEIAAPVKLGGEFMGVISVISDEPGAFDEVDMFTVVNLSGQVAVTLKNSRLYKQAQDLAIREERQRLSRELHDAVSQALFSANLIADVLPKIWEKDPEEGKKRLDELRTLTQGATTEMRSLIMHLRPINMNNARLKDLLRQLAYDFTSITSIPVNFNAGEDVTLPPEVLFAMYRITQETLNNIKKHAHATQIKLSLLTRNNQVKLSIRDDGIGFDLNNLSSEHLGLLIMKERAEAVGAGFEIRSRVGHGANVTITYPGKMKRGARVEQEHD